MENSSSDYAQIDRLTVASERQKAEDGDNAGAIVVVTLSLFIVVVVFPVCFWFLRIRKKAAIKRSSSEDPPLSSNEGLPLERLLLPPPVISVRELRLLRLEWQSLVAAAGGLACLWPEVFLSCAPGARPRDAAGASPGLFYAAALTKFFFQRGIPCLGGDDGKVLGEYGTKLLGGAGQLSARAAECKVLVVIETAALYDSVVCLEEIHAARQARIEIILVRFERNLPCVEKQWPMVESSDALHVEMVTEVQTLLKNAELIPEPPSTIPDDQGELANVLRAVSACILETREIDPSDCQRGANDSRDKPKATQQDTFAVGDKLPLFPCSEEAVTGTRSLPLRWESNGSSGTTSGAVLHAPISINVVAASDTASGFQERRNSAPLTDARFSTALRKCCLNVPPSALRQPETQRSAALRFASPDPSDSDPGSGNSRRDESTPLREAPCRSSRRTMTAPARSKKMKPLRRHDAPRGSDLDGADGRALKRYDASKEVDEQFAIMTSLTDPVHGSGQHSSRYARTAPTLKPPKKMPQDGTNLKKPKKMSTFQRAHKLHVQVGSRSSPRYNADQVSSPTQAATVAYSSERSERSEKEMSDVEECKCSPRSPVSLAPVPQKLKASSDVERRPMVVLPAPMAMVSMVSEIMPEYSSEGGTMGDASDSNVETPAHCDPASRSAVESVVAPQALESQQSSVTERLQGMRPKMLLKESGATSGTRLLVAGNTLDCPEPVSPGTSPRCKKSKIKKYAVNSPGS